MAPKAAKMKVTELLWKEGIAERVGVGSYEISHQYAVEAAITGRLWTSTR